MAYLLCRQCNGYFKLETHESPHDFESCSCGGQLRYLKSIRSFCEDLKADLVEVDNSVLLQDGLRLFKDRIKSETIDFEDSEDYEYYEEYGDYYSEEEEYFGYEYHSEGIAHVAEELGYSLNNSEPTVSSINDLFVVSEEPKHYTEDIFPKSQIVAPDSIYHHEVQSDYSDYLNNYEQYDLFSVPKNYIKNNIITLLGLSIIPLEYYYLFGSLPVMALAAVVMAIPILLIYLPKGAEIKSHEDVQKVFAVWVMYYLICGLILLAWLIFTQRQFLVLSII